MPRSLFGLLLFFLVSVASAAETCGPGQAYYGSCSYIPDPNFPAVTCPSGLTFDGSAFCLDSSGNQVGDANGNPVVPDGYSWSFYGLVSNDLSSVAPRTCGDHSAWNASLGICQRDYSDPYWDQPPTCPGGRPWDASTGCGAYDPTIGVYTDGWGDQTPLGDTSPGLPSTGSGGSGASGGSSGSSPGAVNFSQRMKDFVASIDVSTLLSAIALVAVTALSLVYAFATFRSAYRFVKSTTRPPGGK